MSENLYYGLRQPAPTPQPRAESPNDDTQPIRVPVLAPVKRWYQKPVTWIAGGIAAVVLLIGLAAGGSSADSKFIDRLDEGGIAYSSESAATKAGRSVCDVLDEGYSVNQAAYAAADGTGYSLYEAGFIVGASVYAYCPEYGNQI